MHEVNVLHASVVTILPSVHSNSGVLHIGIQLVYVHVLLAKTSITDGKYLARVTR